CLSGRSISEPLLNVFKLNPETGGRTVVKPFLWSQKTRVSEGLHPNITSNVLSSLQHVLSDIEGLRSRCFVSTCVFQFTDKSLSRCSVEQLSPEPSTVRSAQAKNTGLKPHISRVQLVHTDIRFISERSDHRCMKSDVDSSAYRTESRLRHPLTKRWVRCALTLCPISEGIFWLVLNESCSSLTERRLIRRPPHVLLTSSSRPPHVLLTSSPRPPHVLLTSSPRPPHFLPTSSSRPPHVLLTSSSRKPHVLLTSSSRPPHVLLTSSPRPPHVLPTSSPRPPHVLPTSSSRLPHVLLTSSSRPPHVLPTSSPRPPHVLLMSSPRPPHVLLTSVLRPPNGDAKCNSLWFHSVWRREAFLTQ
ncbi:hypothetical protein KUCAC02_032011, partial [Chaenocephalus aceratus]